MRVYEETRARANVRRTHRERMIARLNRLLRSLISIWHNFIELIIRISRVSPTVRHATRMVQLSRRRETRDKLLC